VERSLAWVPRFHDVPYWYIRARVDTACVCPHELLPGEDQQALAAAIPGSRLVVYQDTGHLVLREQPERVASDLAGFVDSPGPPGLGAHDRKLKSS
jgi:pimeloyl-ACP methyl ester carboxylesterase